MKKVLIVSPRFPPVNAADHQRIRMALPYFRQYGWQPTVLCVDPEFVEAGQDPHLLKTVPSDVSVESVAAIPQSLTRKVGFGGLTWRAKRTLDRRAQELLSKEHFDAVYFSTTEFGILPLAVQWKKKFHIPYVIDIHDPWVNDYYRRMNKPPPGGPWKHRLTQTIARWQEPETLKQAAAITVVSKQYKQNLLRRYPFLNASQFHVLPFGGAGYDFEILDSLSIDTPPNKHPAIKQWLYIGCLGCPMQFSIRAFFCSIRNAIDRNIVDLASLQVRLYGTDYASPGKGRKWTDVAANEFGLTDLVEETPDRLPYFETLKRLREADALFMPGSDDPGYTASKIYPYILARRPLLTLFHKHSSVNNVINNTKSGTAITFDEQSAIESVAEEIYQRWFIQKAYSQVPNTNWKKFAPYTAQSMTEKLSEVFNLALTSHSYRIAS